MIDCISYFDIKKISVELNDDGMSREREKFLTKAKQSKMKNLL
jgi:hypothetical protein